MRMLRVVFFLPPLTSAIDVHTVSTLPLWCHTRAFVALINRERRRIYVLARTHARTHVCTHSQRAPAALEARDNDGNTVIRRDNTNTRMVVHTGV